jgi:nucleoside-diphosphate kinase
MELRTQDAVACLRKLCGPHNPEEASRVNRNSIRGLFGKSLSENAVHCTDLPEDGLIECEYFFTLLK